MVNSGLIKKAKTQGVAMFATTESPDTLDREGKPPSTEVKPLVSNGADVAEFPLTKGRHLWRQWLARNQAMAELKVEYDPEDAVLWCHMAPDGRPSVTPGLARESRALQQSVQELYRGFGPEDELPIRYLVWGSTAPGVFNLGGDLRLFAQLVRAKDRDSLHSYAISCVDVVHANAVSLDLPIITVSMVEGDALGGGFEAAISSDVVVATRNARFALPETLFNLFPGMGAYSLIARRINPIQARRMIMSGRLYTAEELYELGLVDVLVEPGQGRTAVRDLVTRSPSKHAAHCAIYRAERRVNPLSYAELYDIAVMWVDVVMKLKENDLRKMERLAAAQDRRQAAITACD